MVHVYSRHGEVETVQQVARSLGRTGSERATPGRIVTQINRITVTVIVMFPVCVVCVPLCYMCNLFG
jgi:hypothetical protein